MDLRSNCNDTFSTSPRYSPPPCSILPNSGKGPGVVRTVVEDEITPISQGGITTPRFRNDVRWYRSVSVGRDKSTKSSERRRGSTSSTVWVSVVERYGRTTWSEEYRVRQGVQGPWDRYDLDVVTHPSVPTFDPCTTTDPRYKITLRDEDSIKHGKEEGEVRPMRLYIFGLICYRETFTYICKSLCRGRV